MATIFGLLTQRAAATLRGVQARRLRWTKPAPRTAVRGALADVTRSTAALVAENALRRQQLLVRQRTVTRPAVMPRDRVVRVLLARLGRGWQAALLIVQPETLLRWHRHGYRRVGRARAVTAAKRPPVSPATVTLIKRMAHENRLRGAERIRGALLKRGIRVGQRTVQRHMSSERLPRPNGQTWATFLHKHAAAVGACAVLPVIALRVRALVAFVSVELGSRRVVHGGVTRHPTDAWVARMRQDSERKPAVARASLRCCPSDLAYAACSTPHTATHRSWNRRRCSARDTVSFRWWR